MKGNAERLRCLLRPLLAASADKVRELNPKITHDLGWTANDAFVLRAYSEFRGRDDGEEVAITVDAKIVGSKMEIESDVCRSDGTVITVGPTAVVPVPCDAADGALRAWLQRFEQFIRRTEGKIAGAQ